MKIIRAEEAAKRFHELLVELAPSFGCRGSTMPWESVPAPNRELLVLVHDRLLAEQSTSILQPWVTGLKKQHQWVLLYGLGYCESVFDMPSKDVVFAIRAAVITAEQSELGDRDAEAFVRNMGGYPNCFVMRVKAAAQVLGYYHPDEQTQLGFLGFYQLLADRLHLLPESRAHMDDRLCSEE